MEPLRALQSKAPLLARYLVLGEHPWNMWRKDTILWNTIRCGAGRACLARVSLLTVLQCPD